MSRIAVVLFNLGGPDSLNAVEPFLFNLFYDPAIIRLPKPLRYLVARLISSRRKKTACEIYSQIGGRSPIMPQTEVQSRTLQTALQAKGLDAQTFIAMRYWHPRASKTIEAVKTFAPERVILLPLYPQFSTTTTGSSAQEWAVEAKKQGLDQPTTLICCYPDNNGFADAYARTIRETLKEIDPSTAVRVLFSAHGLPKKIVDGGDPYQKQVERSAAVIVERIGQSELDWTISYQSRVGPLEWIGPATDDEIERAGREGKSLIVVPIAFVSEHSETLVELDIEYRALAKRSGVPLYKRIPTVSATSQFIDGLAELVVQAATAGTWPVGQQCRAAGADAGCPALKRLGK